MFHHHGKKPKSSHTRSLNDLIALTTPPLILAEGRRPALLDNIIQSSAMDSARFNSLCLKLIHNIVNHCQRLPETANSYYALPGGLLDHALNRTEAALHLFRHSLAQGHGEPLSEEQQLWLYALFSAAMLQGIGKLQLDYRVEQFDVNGQLLKSWNPLLDTLASTGKYYRFEFIQCNEDDLRRRLNLLLAQQLMPESGFAWIAGNPNVLAAWLALLHEDPNAVGMLGAILERADGIAIQRDVTEFLVRHTGSGGARQGRMGTFIDAAPESSAEKDHLLGAEFIKWLVDQVDKGRLFINKAPLMLIQAGIVMSPETYQLFMRDHPDVRHWQAVHKGLLSWGLLRRDEVGKMDKLVLDKLSAILPEAVQLHHPQTNKDTTVSALELVHRQQAPDNPEPPQRLSLSGEWQVFEAITTELQSGFSRRD